MVLIAPIYIVNKLKTERILRLPSVIPFFLKFKRYFHTFFIFIKVHLFFQLSIRNDLMD